MLAGDFSADTSAARAETAPPSAVSGSLFPGLVGDAQSRPRARLLEALGRALARFANPPGPGASVRAGLGGRGGGAKVRGAGCRRDVWVPSFRRSLARCLPEGRRRTRRLARRPPRRRRPPPPSRDGRRAVDDTAPGVAQRALDAAASARRVLDSDAPADREPHARLAALADLRRAAETRSCDLRAHVSLLGDVMTNARARANPDEYVAAYLAVAEITRRARGADERAGGAPAALVGGDPSPPEEANPAAEKNSAAAAAPPGSSPPRTSSSDDIAHPAARLYADLGIANRGEGRPLRFADEAALASPPRRAFAHDVVARLARDGSARSRRRAPGSARGGGGRRRDRSGRPRGRADAPRRRHRHRRGV